MRSPTLIANILKVTLSFVKRLKCLIAQIKLYKIRSTCKNQGGPLYAPIIRILREYNNVND